jgi:outer membrane protein assembly factor BamB
MVRFVTRLALTALLISTAHGADWPQWRGPGRDGISRETGLLAQWPDGGPKLLWQQTDLGDGYSTPSVVGDRIYVLGSQGNDNEYVEARNVSDGKRVWSTRLGKVGNPEQKPPYPGSRSTPTIDGDRLYALGSDGDLVCLDLASGSLRWHKHLRNDFGGKYGEWAYSESPLIDGDVLVCTPGGEQATMLALNKTSGEVIWKSPIPGGDEAAYASVVVLGEGPHKQYVQFLQNGVVGVDAVTGKFLWRYEKTAKGSPANIPTPVAHDRFVYTASNRGGAGLVSLESSPSGVEAKEVYFSQELPKVIGGAVKVGDQLYGAGGQGLMCVDFATGDVKWRDRSIGAASVLFADGRLYQHGENGEVALVEATPEAYREVGRFTPANRPEIGKSKSWAYPVVANGRLYIRVANALWCYDIARR